jgi:hypothetical protein
MMKKISQTSVVFIVHTSSSEGARVHAVYKHESKRKHMHALVHSPPLCVCD